MKFNKDKVTGVLQVIGGVGSIISGVLAIGGFLNENEAVEEVNMEPEPETEEGGVKDGDC